MDFEIVDISPVLRLNHRCTDRFKTAQIDLFVPFQLRSFDHTRVALISRMLERGTRRLPTLRTLSAFIDNLFGASFSSSVIKLGGRQAIHLNMELIGSRFVPPGGEDQLCAGLAFMREVIYEPNTENGAFPSLALNQEKAALRHMLDGLFSDKLAWARQRCVEEMLPTHPCALSVLGKKTDLERIDGHGLMDFFRESISVAQLTLYITDSRRTDEVAEMCRGLFEDVPPTGPRALRRGIAAPTMTANSRPRKVVDLLDVQQGRIILAYRTDVRLASPRFPALLILNQALGGDLNSRLHLRLREGAGICYHADTFIEPACGLIMLEASVDSPDCETGVSLMEEEMRSLVESSLTASELEQSRLSLIKSLEALDEDRTELSRFHYVRTLESSDTSRKTLSAAFERVTAADVQRVVSELNDRMCYCLRNDRLGG